MSNFSLHTTDMPWLVVYLSHFWSEKLNGWANWHWMLCGSWVVSKLDQQWFLWFYLSIACFFSPTVAKTIMSLVGVCSRFRSQANSLYKVTLRAKRWIPPGWTHMPGTKRHVEKQWALQGSWEQGRHVSLGSISKDKQLNLEKSNRWKPVKYPLRLSRSIAQSGQKKSGHHFITQN